MKTNEMCHAVGGEIMRNGGEGGRAMSQITSENDSQIIILSTKKKGGVA